MLAMYRVYFGRHVVGVSGVSFVFKCRLVLSNQVKWVALLSV